MSLTLVIKKMNIEIEAYSLNKSQSVNTGQMWLKTVFVEIWHEGYAALFVIDAPKAHMAPLPVP